MKSRPGLSYIHNPGQKPLIALTIGELLENASNQFADREAIVSVHQNQRLTYRQLRDESTRVAAGLLKHGIIRGNHVGIWSPNCVEWITCMLAAAKIGCILVNINPAFEAEELRHCLQLGEVCTLVMADSLRGRKFQDVLLRAVPDLKHVNNDGRVESLEFPNLHHLVTIGPDAPTENLKFVDLVEPDLNYSEERVNFVEKYVETHDAYNIQFTSGTTGYPKAALLTHHGTINNSLTVGRECGYHNKEHRICMPCPLFHCFGSVVGVLCSVQYGMTLVMPSPTYSPSKNIQAIKNEKCTTFYGTPTMIIDLIKEMSSINMNAHDLGLELIVTGGAYFPAQLYKELKYDFKVPDILILYGMTECSPVTFHTRLNDDIDQSTTVGRVADHWEAKVVDKEGRMVPFGQPGELWVRGYGCMLGYCDDEVATAATLLKDGWLKTGDLLILDEQGYGTIVGRIKEMIIRGGENISPREVEDVLHTHPDVLEAHVYGAPDERLGEVVCASVRLRPYCHITPQQLKEFCTGKISYYKIPVYIDIIEEFPKTTSGKVQKFRLTKMMVDKLKNSEHEKSFRM